MQPRPEWAPPVEPVQSAQCRQERLLRDVLRGGGVVHDQEGSAMRGGPVQAEELLERSRGPGLRGAHDAARVPLAAPHWLTIRPGSRQRSMRSDTCAGAAEVPRPYP